MAKKAKPASKKKSKARRAPAAKKASKRKAAAATAIGSSDGNIFAGMTAKQRDRFSKAIRILAGAI